MRAADQGIYRRRARACLRPYRAQRRAHGEGQPGQGLCRPRPQRLHRLVGAAAGARPDGRRGRGTAPPPLRRDQCLAADRRAVAALAAGAVRRADPVGGEPRRVRAALSGPHRRDLCRDLQPGAALVLFPADDARRGCSDPLLRTRRAPGRRGSRRTARSTTRTPLPTRRRARASRPARWCFSRIEAAKPTSPRFHKPQSRRKPGPASQPLGRRKVDPGFRRGCGFDI